MIDVVWGINLALVSVVFAVLSEGWVPRRIALASFSLFAGLRLSIYLARRIIGEEEDARYQAIRKAWAGKNIPFRFLAFYLTQAVLASLLAIPVLLMAANTAETFQPLEIAAALIFLLGFVLEAVADAQLAAFKRLASRQAVCDSGLWRYSRHPNYFGEWLMWLAWFVAALSVPFGWLTLYAPLIMLHFLLRVTGVKWTEAQCLKSKGEAYRAYQARTSMFIPFIPRKAS